MGDAMALDQPGHSRPVRKVGSTVVADQRRPAHQRAAQHQRTRDPAHVRRPAEHIALLDVEVHCRVMSDLQRETAMDVDGSLRLAGGAGGVDDHERIIGGHARSGLLVPLARLQQRGPADVIGGTGARLVRVMDDHGFQGRQLLAGGADQAQDVDPLATPMEAGTGDQRLGGTGAEPGLDRVHAEATEQRHGDGPQVGDGEHGNGRFQPVGHEQADAVATLDAPGFQAGGERHDLPRQFGIGGATDLARFSLGDDRVLALEHGVLGLGQDRVHPVDASAGEPARELRPLRFVEIRLERLLPDDIAVLHHHSPVAIGLVDGTSVELVIVVGAHLAHQLGHIGRGNVFSGGLPYRERAVLHLTSRIQTISGA
ncbi:hypothetical protein FQZ97_739960 [compost metagenome]